MEEEWLFNIILTITTIAKLSFFFWFLHKGCIIISDKNICLFEAWF